MSDKQTPFYSFCQANLLAVLIFPVFQGSDLRLGDFDGRTPLHVAACEGHLRLVQYLLNQGASVHAKDRYGDTPLCNAVRFR